MNVVRRILAVLSCRAAWPRIDGLRFLAACACLASWPGQAFALDPSLRITQYQHTSWTSRDGAPTEVKGIVQTADGYLWVAGAEGLFRFDGVTFERIQTLGGESLGSDSVRSLCADASGGLWMALDRGSALFKNGKLLRVNDAVDSCAEVGGVTWLYASGHLGLFKDGKLREPGPEWGIPSVLLRSLFVDRQQTLWLSDAKSAKLWYLPRGQSQFKSFQSKPFPMASVAAADGSMWGTSPAGLFRVAVEAGTPVSTQRQSHRPMATPLIDRDGGFWASDHNGLLHAKTPGDVPDDADVEVPTADSMTSQQGLSSDLVWKMYEDREGNVWAGTATGLDRFRNSALVPVRLPGSPLPFIMAAGEAGSVWAANYNTALFEVDQHAKIQAIDASQLTLPGRAISALFRDPDGTLRVASGADRFWSLTSEGGWSRTFIPKAFIGNGVSSFARDTSGVLWIASGTTGVVARYHDGEWSQAAGEGIPDKWFTVRTMADHQGRLWTNAPSGTIRLVENGKAVMLTKESHGLDVGGVTAFFQRDRDAHVWVGGGTGVAFFDGVRFHSMKTNSSVAPTKISGIVEASNGDLWLHGASDGFRVEAAELKKFYADPSRLVPARRFDALDGLQGTAATGISQSTLIEASDGLIWFSSSAGLAYFDPARKFSQASFPQLHVQAITSGDSTWQVDGPSLTLAPLSKNLTVSYAATALGIPERVRFKHRLDGVDQNWRDAGPRRVATYNDLSPGTYRFHVMSTNDQGAWGGSEAVLDFVVPPAWYQTWAFRALIGLLVVSLLWLAHRTRVAQITKRVSQRLMTQQAERDRIARDLHDTLLQGVQGLIWRLHTMADRLPAQDPTRFGIESALDTADSMLAESRDRVRGLRDGEVAHGGLKAQLREIGESLAIDHPATFSATCEGLERELIPSTQQELCDIAREALSNAFAHAGASTVEAGIVFGERELEVSVHDNGRGIAPDVLIKGKSLHFGLAGMRERAKALGAAFEVTSSPSQGTRIDLRLRASMAYAERSTVNDVSGV